MMEFNKFRCKKYKNACGCKFCALFEEMINDDDWKEWANQNKDFIKDLVKWQEKQEK